MGNGGSLKDCFASLILRICFDSMGTANGSTPHAPFIKEIRKDFPHNSSFLITHFPPYSSCVFSTNTLCLHVSFAQTWYRVSLPPRLRTI